MDHDRWSGFGWGVALSLLIGTGTVGGYCWPQIVEARAEAQQTRDAAQHAEEIAHRRAWEQAKVIEERDHAWEQAIKERDRAVKELEVVKNANKDR